MEGGQGKERMREGERGEDEGRREELDEGKERG